MKLSILFTVFFCSFPVSAEINTIKVGEYDIEYEMRGTGKATIFLEAGGSAGLNDWDPIYNELTKSARTIRYSRIGNGNSSPVKKNYSSEEYAKEANTLLKELNIEGEIVYVAHSYGAYIARIFASKYPERMAAMMLIEPASEHDVDIMRSIDLDRAELEIAQVKLDDMKNGMSNHYLDFWSKRPLPDYPEITDIPVTVIASVKKYENPPLLLFTDKARNMWGKLHTQWARKFPKGKAVLTHKSYHYPQNDEPEMVIEEIIELLNRAYEH